MADLKDDSFEFELRVENVFSIDYSSGKTWKVQPRVAKSKGTDPGQAPTVKAVHLQQQYKLAFGCSFAGRPMAYAMGFRSDKIPKGQVAVRTLPKLRGLYLGEQAPVLVVYHPDDGKALSRIFSELVLDPTLAALVSQLDDDGERHLVVLDGGEAGVLKPVDDPEWRKRMATLRRAVAKLPANSSGKIQLCDLLRLFHLIKVPELVIEKLTMAEWNWCVEDARFMVGDFFDPYFDRHKKEIWIDAVATLSHVLIPSLCPFEIQRNARKLVSLENLMLRCTPPPSDWTMGNIRANWLPMVREAIQTDRVSDEAMDPALVQPDGSVARETTADPSHLRSDRFVDLTGDATFKRAMARAEEPAKKRAKVAADAAEKQERRALQEAEKTIRLREVKVKRAAAYSEILARYNEVGELPVSLMAKLTRYEASVSLGAGRKCSGCASHEEVILARGFDFFTACSGCGKHFFCNFCPPAKLAHHREACATILRGLAAPLPPPQIRPGAADSLPLAPASPTTTPTVAPTNTPAPKPAPVPTTTAAPTPAPLVRYNTPTQLANTGKPGGSEETSHKSAPRGGRRLHRRSVAPISLDL
jgi:hypothetical protein